MGDIIIHDLRKSVLECFDLAMYTIYTITKLPRLDAKIGLKKTSDSSTCLSSCNALYTRDSWEDSCEVSGLEVVFITTTSTTQYKRRVCVYLDNLFLSNHKYPIPDSSGNVEESVELALHRD